MYCTAYRWVTRAVHVARVGLNINTSTAFGVGTAKEEITCKCVQIYFNRVLHKFYKITSISFLKLWVQSKGGECGTGTYFSPKMSIYLSESFHKFSLQIQEFNLDTPNYNDL